MPKLAMQPLPQTDPLAEQISSKQALDFARNHAVESWFYEHVVHQRTLKDRLDRNEPLKDKEADRFERLTLLLDRARESFRDEAKALSWLKSPKHAFAGATPLEHSARESGFIAVLDQLLRIEHGIHA